MRLQVHICFIVRSRTQPQVNNINIEFLPLTLILRIFSQGSFSFKTLGRNQILLKLYIKRKIRGCGPCLDPPADLESSRISSQVFALASPWPAWPWSSLPSWWHRSSAPLQSFPPLETMLWWWLGEACKLRLYTSDVYSIWSWGWASPTSAYVIHLLTLHFLHNQWSGVVPHGQLLTSKPSRYKVLSFTFRVFFLFLLLLRNVSDK